MKYLYPQLNARLAIVGAVLIITLVLLVGCGGGSSGNSPDIVCRNSEGAEITCSENNIVCILFGGCQ